MPKSTTEIFNWFNFFKNEFGTGYKPIDIKYQFPGLDNLGTRQEVTFYVCQYMTLLFIREMRINKQQKNNYNLEQPELPSTNVLKLLNWQESITYFRHCIKVVLKNKKLLETV